MIDTNYDAHCQKLVALLNRVKHMNRATQSKYENEGVYYIYFVYGGRELSIEEKARFMDKLAKILADVDDYRADSVCISMNWCGGKCDGEYREPFMEMRITIEFVGAIADILQEHEAEL